VIIAVLRNGSALVPAVQFVEDIPTERRWRSRLAFAHVEKQPGPPGRYQLQARHRRQRDDQRGTYTGQRCRPGNSGRAKF